MERSELRIGNWITEYYINHKISANQYQTRHIQIPNGVFIDEMVGRMDLYESIPLTEEWLLKFWFDSEMANTQDGPVRMWQKKTPALNFYLEQFQDKTFNYCADNYVPIWYIHQLQNLYFALTGEELTIKE